MAIIRDVASESEALRWVPTGWFYPERKRCLTCRKYFGPLVIKRLYCSYPCADMEPPLPDITQRPRCCRTRVNEAKRAYLYPEEVTSERHEYETIHVYLCLHCGLYHIGHR